MTGGGGLADLAWIGCDWGGSSLRVFAVAADGRVLAVRRSDDGAGGLAPDGFEPALMALVADWLPDAPPAAIRVLICGMAGSRTGWREAAYCDPDVPLTRLAAAAVAAPALDRRIRPLILPGYARGDPPDVMRGEETQLLGLIGTEPGFAGLVCLPGTHSKWARIADDRLTASATMMTGEIFALLARQSILRQSLRPAAVLVDEAGFRAAVRQAMADPAAVLPAMFALRAADLTGGGADPAGGDEGRADPERAADRLSGLLIGLELAALPRTGWRAGEAVVVIGAPALAGRYAVALDACGIPARQVSGETLVIAGLRAAHAQMIAAGS
ncbi:2-keto-3-deoxy-galactonokinase [Tistrella bauzanensis]|uniref:2-keto-3-deoxy-galactonokinase n=1 Tax=Tistrella bauzanensis TaxID=657419 RepID=A0ABQ1IEK0_9PROT|nr:2-dehydro-3-deoxygalactonokinase [Tistrella bauzanensis]GGB36794.1 2-keto-3-deoxy-galactonokinase [Tistrella bauzanensis]